MSEPINIKSSMRDGIPEIDVEEVYKNLPTLCLIDVRRPEEFDGELGHIDGASLITLGPDLETFIETFKNPDELVVFICRSGSRSGTATLMAQEFGLKKVFNMTGGMIRWNDFQLPVVRN